jgi:phage terminase small subunit
MTPKQQRFVDEYLVDGNATQAAIRAGYSQDCAAEIGYENLRKPQIAEAVKRGSSEVQERTQITQEWVLLRLADNVERCRQARPVTDKKGNQIFLETDDGEMVPAYTFNANGANKALELLAKHLGMFIERHAITVSGLTDTERADRILALFATRGEGGDRPADSRRPD